MSAVVRPHADELTSFPAKWWCDPADLWVDDFAGLGAYIDTLYERPEWHGRALCRGQMVDGECQWFPSQHHQREIAAARRVCVECPVRAECHDAGQDQRGVWG